MFDLKSNGDVSLTAMQLANTPNEYKAPVILPAYCLALDKRGNMAYNLYFEKQVCFPNKVLLYNIQCHCNKTIPKEELTTEAYCQESTIINSIEGRLLS